MGRSSPSHCGGLIWHAKSKKSDKKSLFGQTVQPLSRHRRMATAVAVRHPQWEPVQALPEPLDRHSPGRPGCGVLGAEFVRACKITDARSRHGGSRRDRALHVPQAGCPVAEKVRRDGSSWGLAYPPPGYARTSGVTLRYGKGWWDGQTPSSIPPAIPGGRRRPQCLQSRLG